MCKMRVKFDILYYTDAFIVRLPMVFELEASSVEGDDWVYRMMSFIAELINL